MFELFFGDKVIIFTGLDGHPPDADDEFGIPGVGGRKSIAKMLEKLENRNTLTIKSGDPQAAFEKASALFVNVDAAGGVVTDRGGKLLMIKRNGRWDLPKGHVEDGETAAEAAVREVCEETGIDCPETAELITVTHHFYRMEGVWELKHTYWYRMNGNGNPYPQDEEGIEIADWIERHDVHAMAESAFASIKHVLHKAGML